MHEQSEAWVDEFRQIVEGTMYKTARPVRILVNKHSEPGKDGATVILCFDPTTWGDMGEHTIEVSHDIAHLKLAAREFYLEDIPVYMEIS